MIPRGTPDLHWSDLLSGLIACLPGIADERRAHGVIAAHSAPASLACLSVRSGFDLVLQTLALPAGSEIIVSAITIPDMVRIIEHHRLIPVAVDIDPETLVPTPALIAAAQTERTRAVLIAQLFGCRADLTAIAEHCRRHRLMLFEDCAQAFDGVYAGHPDADVRMFSFGPIKTATALGGAIITFGDPALRAQAAALQATYPVQALRSHLQRIVLFAGLKALATPLLYGLFVAICGLFRHDYDALVSRMMRSSRTGSLEERFRRRPNAALLALLARRLGQDHRRRISRRRALAQELIAVLPAGNVPGAGAAEHSHWVLPVCHGEPAAQIAQYRRYGIDASRTASSMTVVGAPGQTPTAERILATVVYIPLHRDVGRVLRRIVGRVAVPQETRQVDPIA